MRAMEPTEKPDHVLARETLSDIVSAAGILADVMPLPRNDYGEPHPGGLHTMLRYDVQLARGATVLTCEYRAGHAVPLCEFTDAPWPVRLSPSSPMLSRARTLQAASAQRAARADVDIRRAIRESWRPSVVDIVAALLSDASSIEGYPDAMAWGEDLGMLPAEDAAAVRRIYRMHAEIAERAPVLRRMLGADYARAADAAGRL